MRRGDRSRGQALVEFTLVAPLAFLLIFAVIVLGLWVFYQQQITNVAREAARWASIHSSTAICPTVGWRDPQASDRLTTYPILHCDGVNNPADTVHWPRMTQHARTYAWAVAPASVKVNACWSGYVAPGTVIPASFSDRNAFPNADQPAVATDGTANTFVQCRIGGVDPSTSAGTLGCAGNMTTAADDPASSKPGNQVTVYACFQWTPPMAGLLFIPSSVTMRAVVTEIIQRQQ